MRWWQLFQDSLLLFEIMYIVFPNFGAVTWAQKDLCWVLDLFVHRRAEALLEMEQDRGNHVLPTPLLTIFILNVKSSNRGVLD